MVFTELGSSVSGRTWLSFLPLQDLGWVYNQLCCIKELLGTMCDLGLMKTAIWEMLVIVPNLIIFLLFWIIWILRFIVWERYIYFLSEKVFACLNSLSFNCSFYFILSLFSRTIKQVQKLRSISAHRFTAVLLLPPKHLTAASGSQTVRTPCIFPLKQINCKVRENGE